MEIDGNITLEGIFDNQEKETRTDTMSPWHIPENSWRSLRWDSVQVDSLDFQVVFHHQRKNADVVASEIEQQGFCSEMISSGSRIRWDATEMKRKTKQFQSHLGGLQFRAKVTKIPKPDGNTAFLLSEFRIQSFGLIDRKKYADQRRAKRAAPY